MPNVLNREIGVLSFNRRVLHQARDNQVPLLERLRFLAIVSNNLDEFFEVRVAGLKQQLGEDSAAQVQAQNSLQLISTAARELVAEQYRLLNQVILPALAQHEVVFYPVANWSPQIKRWAQKVFNDQIEPILTPIALDQSRPFPRIFNKSLNFIVELQGDDVFGRKTRIGIVQAPRILPRVISVPQPISGLAHGLVLLTSVVQAFVGQLFPGMTVLGVHQFRLTRNSDLELDDVDVIDLRDAVEDELSERNFGEAVRLEISRDTPANLIQFLSDTFAITQDDCYEADGPVNLMRLQQVIDMVPLPNLKYSRFVPRVPKVFEQADLFAQIRKRDLLLHHPYESFAPVMDFLRRAASDPSVVAIKQTIYRTGADSALMETLIAAARAGKEVTVVLELMARFDEQTNVNWSDRLERVGAHVVYGVVGVKTHAKMALLVRREGKQLRRYAHIGTGNYHPRTAMVYEDFGMLTADPILCNDVHEVFRRLTGAGQIRPLKHLLQAPFDLHDRMMRAIDLETRNARAGKQARIAAKMNSLLEPTIIEALYAASQAGVKVDLIVRGVCALRPGLSGFSENITVRSVVGRFLEHSRVFYFWAGGEQNLYLSSADWMDRNFFRRVEIATPVLDPQLRQRILEEAIEIHLLDEASAWVMDAQGDYTKVSGLKDEIVNDGIIPDATVKDGTIQDGAVKDGAVKGGAVQDGLVSQWALMAHLAG